MTGLPTTPIKGTDRLREMAGAVVDLELRTSVELGDRVDRWTAEPGIRDDADRMRLVNEFNFGTLGGVSSILTRWASRPEVNALLPGERHHARSETFEELVANEGRVAAEAIYRAMELPIPAQRGEP